MYGLEWNVWHKSSRFANCKYCDFFCHQDSIMQYKLNINFAMQWTLRGCCQSTFWTCIIGLKCKIIYLHVYFCPNFQLKDRDKNWILLMQNFILKYVSCGTASNGIKISRCFWNKNGQMILKVSNASSIFDLITVVYISVS